MDSGPRILSNLKNDTDQILPMSDSATSNPSEYTLLFK